MQGCKSKKRKIRVHGYLMEICAGCGNKNCGFMKEQEASGLLSSLRIWTPLSKISLVGPLLF